MESGRQGKDRNKPAMVLMPSVMMPSTLISSANLGSRT